LYKNPPFLLNEVRPKALRKAGEVAGKLVKTNLAITAYSMGKYIISPEIAYSPTFLYKKRMRKKITQRCQIHSPVRSILNKKVGKEFIPGLARFEESARKSVEGREALGCEEMGRVNWG
jgi:hypothetical protein